MTAGAKSRTDPTSASTQSPVEKLALIRAACGLSLPTYEARTLVLLASFLGADGNAWPSQRTLAAHLHIDLRHVARSIRSLIAKRLVEVAEAGTRSRSTRYAVNADEIRRLGDASTGVRVTPLQATRCRLYRRHGDACRGVTGDASTGVVIASEGQAKCNEAQTETQRAMRSATGAAPGGLRRRAAPRAGKGKAAAPAWLAQFVEAEP